MPYLCAVCERGGGPRPDQQPRSSTRGIPALHQPKADHQKTQLPTAMKQSIITIFRLGPD